MSFPEIELNDIDLDIAIVNVLASITLEEIGLSHILNAEGEKLQALVAAGATITELTTANENVHQIIDGAGRLEYNISLKIAHLITQPNGFKVSIPKLDAGNPNTVISGGHFILQNINPGVAPIYTVATDGDVEFPTVPPGTYTLSEGTQPYGYARDTNTYTVRVSDDGSVTVNGIPLENFSLSNAPEPITINIRKMGRAGDTTAYDGVVFGVYDGNLEIGTSTPVTGADGYATITIPNPRFGDNFTIRELNPPQVFMIPSVSNLSISSDYGWKINGIGVTNPATDRIDIMNTNINYLSLLKTDSWGNPVPGAVLELDDGSTINESQTSNALGVVDFTTGLPQGTYTIDETTVPAGFIGTPTLQLDVDANSSYTINGQSASGYHVIDRYNAADRVIAVNGRTLPAADAGDTSDWIEVATFTTLAPASQQFSLLVRAKPIYDGIRATHRFYNDISNNLYEASQIRDVVNDWYQGTNYFENSLPANANIRNYAVGSDAVTDAGTFADAALTTPLLGFSQPQPTTPFQKDTAFVLSAEEAKKFISESFNGAAGSTTAAGNFNKLEMAGAGSSVTSDMWLRTPSPSGASVMRKGYTDPIDPSKDILYGDVEEADLTKGRRIYPAIWVKSNIFP